MGPKRADNANKGFRLSQATLGIATEQENQQCVGKFAADLELCCREVSAGYPVNIPVCIRGYLPPVSVHQQATYSGASATPSLAGGVGEEQIPSTVKRLSRGRIPSVSHSGIITAAQAAFDNDNRSFSVLGHEATKGSSTSYRTFNLVRDSDFFRPKLLVDSTGNETETIDQINTLYMRAWQLDQRFIEIFKKILPLQEQLHTLKFCFVGLNEQTIYGLAEVCQLIKNLKTVSLDGNPLASEHFHILIEKDDSKIAHLSLRFCKINDQNAERLANAIGNMSTQNWKLLTLSLTGNRIGDNGAKSFAKALRYNRTLISLNLSSNFITDKGGCALALVLRKIVLTQEEIIRRRYLLSERHAETHLEDLRNNAPSPTLSTISTKSKSGRDPRRAAESGKRKSITMKSTDKRHRIESGGDENRPTSASRSDQKKGKNDGATGRSTSVNPRRSAADQTRTTGNVRGKKLAGGVSSSSKKNISVVKEEDEHTIEGLITLQMQYVDRENPLLEMNPFDLNNDEICLRGNLVLLSLNLSRNYLTLNSVNEFLLSIQHQSTITHFNDTSSTSSTMASIIEFSGLCRLEMKGMGDISIKSPVYQSVEAILFQKNPSARCQQFKEREAKELLDQQQLPQVPQQTIPEKVPEKTRAASNVKSMSQRPASRLKD